MSWIRQILSKLSNMHSGPYGKLLKFIGIPCYFSLWARLHTFYTLLHSFSSLLHILHTFTHFYITFTDFYILLHNFYRLLHTVPGASWIWWILLKSSNLHSGPHGKALKLIGIPCYFSLWALLHTFTHFCTGLHNLYTLLHTFTSPLQTFTYGPRSVLNLMNSLKIIKTA